MDRDILLVYKPEDTVKYSFSGRRVNSGLYRVEKSSINADINGVANIIRKYRPDADFSALDRTIFLNPCRVRVLDTPRKKPRVIQKKSRTAA